MSNTAPLAGVRIIECSILGPGALTTHLVDLGADVIKIEPLGGDYVRQMTWPIVDGVSLMHLHINRGKRSMVVDLRTPEGVTIIKDLVRDADAVIEGMRPGGLAKRGLGYDDLRAVNPRIVFCSISGYGTTGPYRDLPSHGIAFDAWAGLVTPEIHDGFSAIPEHPSIGMHAGPLFGAFGVVSAILGARATGRGCEFEVAQSDAAASMDWLRSETWKAYERPQTEVTGNPSDDFERRAPGTAGMRDGVRYQFYATADGGHVLFMASEQSFWRNFCDGLQRLDLFERWPGKQYGDHAVGNDELHTVLRDIFLTRSAADWIEFGRQHDAPIAPVNTPKTLADDPQFRARFEWTSIDETGAAMLPTPLKFADTDLQRPTRAPDAGQHTDEILRSLLDYDDDMIAGLRSAGAIA